ncbi:MAG: RNA-binding protein [Pirellulaceae bacterium]
MGKKLYCGNLVFGASSSDLEQLFGQYGAVASAQVISDRETGRSKGFGFVEMSTDEEANAAIEGLNDKDYEGRPLVVNEMPTRRSWWWWWAAVAVDIVAVAIAEVAVVADATKSH